MHLQNDIHELLDHVIMVLHNEDVIMMPLKSLYRIIQKHIPESVSLENLENLIRQDTRFLMILPHIAQTNEPRFMNEDELESIGYDNGPRIMIRSRMPENREMLSQMIGKADRTFDSLKHAWDIRTDGDTETEDRLLGALAKAQRLQRELTLLTSEFETIQEPIEYT